MRFSEGLNASGMEYHVYDIATFAGSLLSGQPPNAALSGPPKGDPSRVPGSPVA